METKLGKVKTRYGIGDIILTKYADGNKAVIINDEITGERISVLTVNMPEIHNKENQFLIKTWSENEEIARDVFNTSLFINTGTTVPTGYTQAQIWKLK